MQAQQQRGAITLVIALAAALAAHGAALSEAFLYKIKLCFTETGRIIDKMRGGRAQAVRRQIAEVMGGPDGLQGAPVDRVVALLKDLDEESGHITREVQLQGFRTLIATSLVETWALKLVALVIHGKEEALRQQRAQAPMTAAQAADFIAADLDRLNIRRPQELASVDNAVEQLYRHLYMEVPDDMGDEDEEEFVGLKW